MHVRKKLRIPRRLKRPAIRAVKKAVRLRRLMKCTGAIIVSQYERFGLRSRFDVRSRRLKRLQIGAFRSPIPKWLPAG